MLRHTPLIIGIVIGILLTITFIASAAAFDVEETSLSTSGQVHEINQAPNGQLVISDPGAAEIWVVDPESGDYTTYGFPSGWWIWDGHMDPDGNIWWTDSTDTFGVLNPAAGTATVYTQLTDIFTEGLSLSGIAFDSTGHIWLSEWFGSASKLHQFNPQTEQLCPFQLPGAIYSDYLEFDGTNLWYMNWFKGEIGQFNPITLAIKRWDTPDYGLFGYQGFDLDPNGNLWWVNGSTAEIVQLDPNAEQRTNYALPTGSGPTMITTSGTLVRYTENVSATVGTLDPTVAAGTTTSITYDSGTATPNPCIDISVYGTVEAVTTQTGTFSWTTAAATKLVEAGGWLVYDLPDGSASDTFLGIAMGGDFTWVTDQGRQKLIRIGDIDSVSLTVTKAAQFNSLPAPGGTFNYTATVTNPSTQDTTTISAITDTYGTPSCSSLVLPPGSSTECTFSVEHLGSAGDSWTNQVYVTATNQNGVDVSAISNQVTVQLTDPTGFKIFLPLLINE